jgi:hypothetical protein
MRKAKTREILIHGKVTMTVIYGAGEPCAVKTARTVREGAVGKGLGTEPRLPPTSSQRGVAATSIKGKERALLRRYQNIFSQGGLSAYDTP